MKIGDHVLITGTIYTARDAAHNRMVQALDEGKELPIDVRGQLIYYVGPTPTRPGKSSGAFGPTTAMRMDPFTPRLLEAGLKVCMGKGNRGPEVQEALKKYTAVYLMAVGGAAAMLSQYREEDRGRRLRGPGHGVDQARRGRRLPCLCHGRLRRPRHAHGRPPEVARYVEARQLQAERTDYRLRRLISRFTRAVARGPAMPDLF